MTPRADFSCLSPKCRTEEGAPVYELPVGATRCPVCGSKRVVRIWTPPHVAHGVAKHVDALVSRSGFVEQRHEQRDGRMRHEANVREAAEMVGNGAAQRAGVMAGPASQLGALTAKATGFPGFASAAAGAPGKSARADGVVLGGRLPRGRINHEVSDVVAGRPIRPAVGSPRWDPPK